MAKSSSVWGIEIGQSALKALRCSLVDGEVVADAFDYIEYPKILSQPEAVAEELVADAMAQLMERNEGMTDKLCVSVPGQSGLSKFFKPPPVEVKKIADLVRYEARQQIPFELSDVVWDYQMMPGSMVEDGYALESEVGLFAMKREQAYRQLNPFEEANLEVDVVQLAPIALYNMVAYDRMSERIETEVFNSEEPPSSSVVLSIGTDSSDLIITNGFRIWQRSMPIGGNHFTRQLTKDLKMTFAKAEHLKRNAREAVDPKKVFQTMRPVFNDLVTEVQRSIGFFRSIDRNAEINELLITGNTVKMPGLAAYLGKNLGFEVHVLDRFGRLGGDDVLAIPTFRDNATTFAVCYGLCLQGLGISQVHASLVPQEIITQRMIRAKKPWTIAGLAVLMVGMSANYFFTQNSWSGSTDPRWDAAGQAVTAMSGHADGHKDEDSKREKKLTFLNAVGEEITGDAEHRLVWMELLSAINQIVPRGKYEGFGPEQLPDHKQVPYEERIDFHITSIDTKFYTDVAPWYEDRATRFAEEKADWEKIMGIEKTAEEIAAEAADTGPTGEAWVIELQGYHHYNDMDKVGLEGNNHIRKYMTTAFLRPDLLNDKEVLNTSIKLPNPANPQQILEYTPAEFGIKYPLLLNIETAAPDQIPNPDYVPPDTSSAGAPEPNAPKAESTEEPYLTPRKMDFIFQFVWFPTTHSERVAAKQAAQEAEAQQNGGTTAPAQEGETEAVDNSVASNP